MAVSVSQIHGQFCNRIYMHANYLLYNKLTSSVSFANSCNTNSLVCEANSDTFTLSGGDINIGGNSFTSTTVIITVVVSFNDEFAAVLVPTTVRL